MRLYPGFTRLPLLLHSEMRLQARVPIINMRFLNNVCAIHRLLPLFIQKYIYIHTYIHTPAATVAPAAALLPCLCRRSEWLNWPSLLFFPAPSLAQVEADIRIHPPDTCAVRFLQRLAEKHAPAFTALAVVLKVLCFMHNIDKVRGMSSLQAHSLFYLDGHGAITSPKPTCFSWEWSGGMLR